jgi:4-hydroxy-tetrahydrodipicolinate synthase
MIDWLRGVIPAVITPFDGQGNIDEQKLKAEIEYQLSCGVSAVCAGGTTGEGAGMSPDDVSRVIRCATEQIKGHVPVIAGMIPDTTNEAIKLALAAKNAGAAALQVTPPHYVLRPGTPELVSYYLQIHQATGLDVILYNVIPWAQVTPDQVEELIAAGGICAVKQSGSNMHYLADLVYRFGDRIPILCAVDDLLYPAFVLGAQGTLSAIASVLPKQCVELYEAVGRGDHQKALRLHNQLLVVWRALEDMDGFIGRVKYAIEVQGRPAGLPRHPVRPAREDEQIIVRNAFQEAGIPLPAYAKRAS